MLYIWPFIAFFSAPLLLAPMYRILTAVLLDRSQVQFGNNSSSTSTPKLPGIVFTAVFMTSALAAVHFNTIIHPYTLADNRHYVFYVFKILRRHSAIRYLAVPVYYTCAWLAWQCLAARPNSEDALRHRRENGRPTSDKFGRSPCQISFITVWLITTALSVMTAPLVEPRYFIIPWIIWRLHVPSRPASLRIGRSSAVKGYDVRLGLETVWLLAINATITYLFIYRGFSWPSEPGKVQRFLW
jgi:alpha-1,2-glucosyltransferase